MSRQLFAGKSFYRPKGFTSASAVCGVGRHRHSGPSVCRPFGRCGVGGYSSRSLQNLGGSKKIPCGEGYRSGVYGGFGVDHCMGYGGWRCGDACYSNEGFGGVSFGRKIGLCGPRGHGALGNYGGSCRSEGIHRVRVNENLLQPLSVGVDPEIQQIRAQEREQIKKLNNQFACFIDKVRCLEQQNKVLGTKWNLLQEQVLPCRKNLQHLFENYLCSLRRQLDCLLSERGQLEPELQNGQKLVEELKCKYEQEINRRTASENEFVLLKKDVDCIYMSKVELEAKVETLRQEIEFLRCMYAQEIVQMEGNLCDTSVVVKMDNNRDLDMEGIIREIECWYEEIAQKSKAEVDALYRTRFQELQETKGRYCNNLKCNHHEITELNQVVRKLQYNLENVKKEVVCLQTRVCETEQCGDCALKDAQGKYVELQNALQKAKDELASMLRDYQELLNIKLALDIEIAMYKTLLEGEENRIFTGSPVRIVVTTPCNVASDCGYGDGTGAGCGYLPAHKGCIPGYERQGTVSGGFSCRSGGYYPRGRGCMSRGAEHGPAGGFTSRSLGSCVGRQYIPGGMGYCPVGGYPPPHGGFSSRSGGYTPKRSFSFDLRECNPGAVGSYGSNCTHVGSSVRAGYPRGVGSPGVKISVGPPAPGTSRCKTTMARTNKGTKKARLAHSSTTLVSIMDGEASPET